MDALKLYEEKKVRDRGDLRRNLINSVFEGLKVEGCLADRGDAKPLKTNKNNKLIDKIKKKEVKDDKLKAESKAKEIAINREDIKKNKDPDPMKNILKSLLKEDPICPIKANLNMGITKEKGTISSKKEIRKDKSESVKTYLDLEGRKKLRDRYTVKLKSSVKNTEDENAQGNSKLFDELVKNKAKGNQSNSADLEKEKSKRDNLLHTQRTPLVKTVTVKDNNRVFKDVSFVDRKATRPIQIKIPSDAKKAKPEMKNKGTDAIKELNKVVNTNKHKKKHRLKGRIISPDVTKRHNSPTTEVAKWAPSCLTQHTKPYYEAWVDTTLAAINKSSDKLSLEKQNIINNFKKALDQMECPEEVWTDERYAGKITVRHSR